MKKIICFITIILLLPSSFCFAEIPLYTQSTIDIHNPDLIEQEYWDYINAQSPNELVTASLMGIIYRESNFRSNAVAGWHLNLWYDESGEFTKRIDKGLDDSSSLEDFIYCARYLYGGYGLVQWCMPKTLEKFYNFMKERETTIADFKAQIDFLFWDLQENHAQVWEQVCEFTDLYLTATVLATYYEGTKSSGTTHYYAMVYYNRYANK